MAVGLTMQLKFPATKEWLDRMEDVKVGAAEEVEKVCTDAAEIARSMLEELTPKDTGATARLWEVVVQGWGNGLKKSHRGRFGPPLSSFVVRIDHPYNKANARSPVTGEKVNAKGFNLLEALEYGTRPHTISAIGGLGKSNKPLSFKVGGKWISTYIVKHPGTKAYGMVRKTSAIVQRIFENAASTILDRVLAKLNVGNS